MLVAEPPTLWFCRDKDGDGKCDEKVAIFTDRLKHLARYTKITAAANVVQTPTLIVVNRQEKAQVATGYMDEVSIDQYVVDALHGE